MYELQYTTVINIYLLLRLSLMLEIPKIIIFAFHHFALKLIKVHHYL